MGRGGPPWRAAGPVSQSQVRVRAAGPPLPAPGAGILSMERREVAGLHVSPTGDRGGPPQAAHAPRTRGAINI